MEVHTIGFTKKSAEEFFGILKAAGVKRLIDVRLNNVSQLAGFAKRKDLEYFLRELCGIEYIHELQFAPEKEMLDAYKKNGGAWEDYEREFRQLMRDREIEKSVGRELFEEPAALLCSEPTAEHCHRRLVLEHLRETWGDVEVNHL